MCQFVWPAALDRHLFSPDERGKIKKRSSVIFLKKKLKWVRSFPFSIFVVIDSFLETCYLSESTCDYIFHPLVSISLQV